MDKINFISKTRKNFLIIELIIAMAASRAHTIAI